MDILNELEDALDMTGQGVKARESRSKIPFIGTANDVEFRGIGALAKYGLTDWRFRRRVHKKFSKGNKELSRTFACPEAAGMPEGSCAACNKYRAEFKEQIEAAVKPFNGSYKDAKASDKKIEKLFEDAAPFDPWFEDLAPGIDRTNKKFGFLRVSNTLYKTMVKSLQGVFKNDPMVKELMKRQDEANLEAYLMNKVLHPREGFDMQLGHPTRNTWSVIVNPHLPTPLLDEGDDALNETVVAFLNSVKELPEAERSDYLYKIDMWKPAWIEEMTEKWWKNTGRDGAATSVAMPEGTDEALADSEENTADDKPLADQVEEQRADTGMVQPGESTGSGEGAFGF